MEVFDAGADDFIHKHDDAGIAPESDATFGVTSETYLGDDVIDVTEESESVFGGDQTAAEPHFGSGGWRFDIPDAVSDKGNPVSSDSSGQLVDRVTGEKLSRY